MKFKSNTFYYLQTEDLPGPILAYSARKDRQGKPKNTYIAVDITISGDRTVIFQVMKWLEDTPEAVRFQSDSHGEVTLSRLDQNLYMKLKETCPFCENYTFTEMKLGVGGVKV